MKKFLTCCLLLLPVPLSLCGCKKKIDYFDYVSEFRKEVFILKEDDFELKIYCSQREKPYSLDGIKGEMINVTEVYYKSEVTPDEVQIDIDGRGGEMSYMSVTRSFYLSFDGLLETSTVQAELTVDGNKREVQLSGVAAESAIDGREALECVRQYDAERFEELTKTDTFEGEIQIRLIYDEGCYYFVGICDRQSKINAYLVDGCNGRILAEKEQTV